MASGGLLSMNLGGFIDIWASVGLHLKTVNCQSVTNLAASGEGGSVMWRGNLLGLIGNDSDTDPLLLEQMCSAQQKQNTAELCGIKAGGEMGAEPSLVSPVCENIMFYR